MRARLPRVRAVDSCRRSAWILVFRTPSLITHPCGEKGNFRVRHGLLRAAWLCVALPCLSVLSTRVSRPAPGLPGWELDASAGRPMRQDTAGLPSITHRPDHPSRFAMEAPIGAIADVGLVLPARAQGAGARGSRIGIGIGGDEVDVAGSEGSATSWFLRVIWYRAADTRVLEPGAW